MHKIFICYRREDSAYPAHHLYNSLTAHFGDKSVVFDVDTVPPGNDFREYINRQISQCDVMVALLGNRWLEILTQQLETPQDFVRIELETAFERQMPVIPVLVDRASMPEEESLPPNLSRLAYINATEMRAGPDLGQHVERLINNLKLLFADQEESRAAQEIAREGKGSSTENFRGGFDGLYEDSWYKLIRRIRDGDCILVLGYESVFDPEDIDCTPLEDRLAAKLINDLDMFDPPNVKGNLHHITQLYRQERDRYSLEKAVSEFYVTFTGGRSEFHRNLAMLPFDLCLLTTLDVYLIDAFLDVGKKPQQAVYNYRRNERMSDAFNPTPENPVVYNLFGGLDNEFSMVLTENDVLDLQYSIASNRSPIPAYISSRLSDSQTSILFIGFGFHRSYARFLVHCLLKERYSGNSSLALEGSEFFVHPDFSQMSIFFDQQNRIRFSYCHSLTSFAEELRVRYEAL